MITLENICKTFETDSGTFTALQNVNLEIDKGDIFGIIGYSGAGKSTLVRCINLLERPTDGRVYVDGIELTSLSKEKLREQRKKIGMIFQQFNLLAQRSVLDNICYPLEISGVRRKQAKQKALELLELVGLYDKAKSYPSQLSGGQKQRVAIARALATDPEVLLCDEATSALDPNTTESILELLQSINRNLGVTIVIITHEMKVVEKICNKVAVIDQGEIVECGEVGKVFMNPQSDIAREFIQPQDEPIKDKIQEGTIRIAFDGRSSFEPVIANMILACKIPVNILGATTEDIGGKAYGQMILELPPDKSGAQRIRKYLTDNRVAYEEK